MAELYETVLRKQPEADSDALVRVLAAGKLPRERKLAILEEGASNARLSHRLAALAALAELDPPTFRKHLIATLRWLPKDVEGETYWACPEGELAWLVQVSDDPGCWDALAAAARRASVGLRFQLVGGVTQGRDGVEFAPAAERRLRRERLRFLAGFLGDDSARGANPPAGKEYWSLDAGGGSPTLEVRDFAARQLAWLYGVTIPLDLSRVPGAQLLLDATKAVGLDLPSALDRREFPRMVLRAVVRELAERELAGGR